MKMLRTARVSQMLSKARDIIAARWNKHHYVTGPNGENKSDLQSFLGIPDTDDDDWGYCGDGALRRAIKNEMKMLEELPKPSQVESLLYDCQKALAGPIQKRLERDGRNTVGLRSNQIMWCFNDLPTTTKEDILAVYDEAIAENCAKVEEWQEQQKNG